MDNSTCMKCGSSNLDSGFIRSFTKMAYKSGDKPLDLVFDYFPEEKWPRIQARLCLDCGHLELFCDPKMVKKQLGQADEAK